MAFLLGKLPGLSGLSNMMPPKKSKAARTAVTDGDEDEQPNDTANNEVVADEEAPEDEAEDNNIFKVEVLYGKRARSAPASETHLNEWLSEHVETKEGFKVNTVDAYEQYVSTCVSEGAFALNQSEFSKMLKQKFPDGSTIKESSPLLTLVRVKKAKKEEGEKPKREKSASSQIKMKDVLQWVIQENGNPSRGVSYRNIMTRIITKYPELQIDKRPKYLLGALERLVSYGQLELVRGIGKLGYYREPGPALNEEEDMKLKKKKEKKDDQTENDSEEKNDSEKSDEKTVEDDKEAAEQKDDKDEEKESQEKDKEDDAAEEDSEDKTRRKRAKKENADKKPAKKKSAPAKKFRSFVIHSDPQRIEDTFSLAMTFMVEPKECGTRKLIKYVQEHYDNDLSIDTIRKCLEHGCDKGYWEQVTATGLSGRYRLLMDEIDPTADDDLIGQISNALIACTEPKQCSASLLKSYLTDYHPDFQVSQKPHLFKHALERGIKKKVILRLSGIGASGSFQLYSQFTPNPTILKGEDQEDDYEQEIIETQKTSSRHRYQDFEDPGEGYGQFHISSFQDAYKPRPSKRRGHGRVASTGQTNRPVSLASKGAPANRFRSTTLDNRKETQKKSQKAKRLARQRATHYAESSDDDDEEDEDEEEDEEEEPPKRKRGATSRSKNSGRRASRYDDDDDDDEPPKKKKPATPKSKKTKANTAKSTPSRSTRKKVASYRDDDEDEDEEDEAPAKKTPSKSNKRKSMSNGETPKRGRGTPASSRRQKRISYNEDSDEDDDETPKRKRGTPASSKRQVKATSHWDDDSEEETSRKRGGSTPSKSRKRTASSSVASPRTPSRQRSVKSYADPSSDDDDDEEDVDSDEDARPAKRSTKKKSNKRRR